MKMSIRSQKTFVLGVGAQKAGTSWLHHQLASRADTDFGFLKEYHVFDVIFHSEYEYFRPKRVAPWKWRGGGISSLKTRILFQLL